MRSNSTVRRSMGAGYGSTVHKRKSAPPDPQGLLDPLVVHDPRAAQAADALPVVTPAAVVVTAGLLWVLLHRRANAKVGATASRVRDDLAVPGLVAMPVRARVFGETSVATTGAVTVTAVNVDARAQPRARAAVVVAAAVVVVALAKITTKCHPRAVSSTTSTTGTSDFAGTRPPANPDSARRSASPRACGVAERQPSVSP